jgi:hypothetical protein
METPPLNKIDGRRKIWNRQGKGPDGLSREITAQQLTARDLRVMQALEKYPVLDTYHLFELVGGKCLKRFKERLRLLSDPPNNWILWPHRQTYRANNYLKVSLWQRSRRAREELLRRGLPVNIDLYPEYKSIFEHQYLTYGTLASIELGGAKLDIIRYKEPLEVSIEKELDGELHKKTFRYTNDELASITFDNGGVGYIQLELEKGNSVRRNNLEQASFQRKFLALKVIMEKELYKTKWGLPNLLSLFVSPFPEKIGEMKEVVLEETNGIGVPWLLFETTIGFDDPYFSLKPRPELFTGTWERTGKYAPWSLSTPPKLR